MVTSRPFRGSLSPAIVAAGSGSHRKRCQEPFRAPIGLKARATGRCMSGREKGLLVGQGGGCSLVAAGVMVLFGLKGASMTVEGAGSMGQTGCSPPPLPRSRPSTGPQRPSIVPGHPCPARPAGALLGRAHGFPLSHVVLAIALRLTSG
jgi:hypothetical protein